LDSVEMVADSGEGVEALEGVGVEEALSSRIRTVSDTSGCLPFNQRALQRYVLHCAQSVEVHLCPLSTYPTRIDSFNKEISCIYDFL